MENNKLKQDHHKVSASHQEEKIQYLAGRGAQFNTKNRFLKDEKTQEHIEGVDDWEASNIATQYIEMQSKTIVNNVESKDVGMGYSMNPYAGCEHGCIYCYARNVHEYWGYSAVPGIVWECFPHSSHRYLLRVLLFFHLLKNDFLC